MSEVPELPAKIITCRQGYVDAHLIETDELLGYGIEGFVWRTSRNTALKIHRLKSDYNQERDVYFRLRDRTLRRLSGFTIPLLLNCDDSCLALELSIVKRPFLLDFARAYLDSPFPELDDPAWLAERARKFGRDWPDVLRLLRALFQYGISYRDVHPGNISLR
jgi:hypothetical protein